MEGVGFLGEGKYKAYYYNGEKSVYSKEYKAWIEILKRCYNKGHHLKRKTYIDCEICDSWKNYQIFAEWYNENFYSMGNEKMCLDKDILLKGNKIYSPETCVFVTDSINSLFVKNNSRRGNLPLGVTFDKNRNKYIAYIRKNRKSINLGGYATKEKAFNAYKIEKEQHIKKVANYYKNRYTQFPKKLYDAMANYKIEIND